MEDTSEKSQWAFDCRPWEGGRWHEDLPDGEMKTKYPQGKMVHIGIKQEWDPSETGAVNRGKYGSWTRPLIPDGEKAKWGATQEARYFCCDDLDHCGVVCIVAQGEEQAWNFRRQSPEYRSKKPNRCINQRKWFGESMYHNLTKRHIARTLDLASWKEEFGIESVHLEKELTFERENESIKIQPDIHFVRNDGSRIYIEVVYKNPPKRLHHDLYGEGLAIIDLRDEANRVVLSSGDEEERIKSFRSWVRKGGIEEALREVLNLQRRQHLFQRRQENFERNNITIVREYFSEIGDERDSKWDHLSKKSIQALEGKIEEGMSKDMVRALCKTARVVERMGYLVVREKYFSRLTYVLGRGGTKKWITITEARRILGALEKWNGMERVESIDWCIENSVETEDALLNCLGLQKDSLTINGLSDTELLKQFHFGPYE